MKENIQFVSDGYLCSNCGACSAICPKNAISFQTTNIGRLYASVDHTCVECGLCVKVCPSLDRLSFPQIDTDPYIGNILSVDIGRSTNQEYYQNAQSGGVCTSILAYLFDTRAIDAAVVCRMEYDVLPKVSAIIVTDKGALKSVQKSCYTPVNLLSCLRETHRYSSVAIVGLPCHIQGVVALMKVSRKFANITYKIGLICDRTLCSGIQNVICSYIDESLESIKIDWRRKDFNYKEKYYDYKSAPVVVYDKKGWMTVMPNVYRFALKDMFTAPRCRICYDKLNTFCDITLGDPWLMSGVDWKHGASLVMARTEKGMTLLREMQLQKKLILSSRNIQEVVNGQRIKERKGKLPYYVKAFDVFPYSVNKYLVENKIENFNKKELEKARKEFKEFMINDASSQTEIIKKAHARVAEYEKRIKRNNHLIWRILYRIKLMVIK